MDLVVRWGNPSAFYLLLLIPFLLAVYFYFEKHSFDRLSKTFGKKVTTYLSQTLSLPRRRLQIIVQALALLFLVLALARPQAGESQQEIKSEGIEMIVLADVSESMLSEDVKPSRLAQMKIDLSKLLELMPGNKIGIIAFAGSSALLSPLTSDPNALRMYIDSLDTDSVSTQGTNFETALGYAKEAFEKGGVTQDKNGRTTRVILIESDGEDQEKGALEVAKTLAKEDIRIYSVAYGTEKGGAIPMRDNSGNMMGYKRDQSGQTVLTQVHGDFLKSLADAGNGQFYHADFNGDHLKKFVADVGDLEKSQFQSSMMTQYEEKFTWPLLIGLILMWWSFFISDRNTNLQTWTGKYETNS
jgi:Ca-activated chloride channel homolog